MYGCDSWTIKKAECWRTDAFELWYWRRFLRVPWTARRSNQSILKEVSPEYSLDGLMLKLKLQYFDHLIWRTNALEKTLMLGKTEVRKRRGTPGRGGWMASLTQWIWVWVNSGSWWWRGTRGVLQSIGFQRVGHDWATELNWIGGKYKCSLKRRRPYSLGRLRESVSPLILPTVVLPMCVHLQNNCIYWTVNTHSP